jgi:hypothetical protein
MWHLITFSCINKLLHLINVLLIYWSTMGIYYTLLNEWHTHISYKLSAHLCYYRTKTPSIYTSSSQKQSYIINCAIRMRFTPSRNDISLYPLCMFIGGGIWKILWIVIGRRNFNYLPPPHWGLPSLPTSIDLSTDPGLIIFPCSEWPLHLLEPLFDYSTINKCALFK